MILADKIINERKKNGWSQEELAEQLSVTRQSVSKWEGAQAVPDIQKIIAMAEIFGVSTDYLLKDDIELENRSNEIVLVEDKASAVDYIKVTLEEASEYLEITRKNTPLMANAVSLCILSPVILILMAGMSEMPGTVISESIAAAVGLIVLLVMVAVAVFIFIICDSRSKKYEFIEKEPIETAYGVNGMVQARKQSLEARKTVMTAAGVVLCILSAVPLLITACLNLPEYIIVGMVCVLLVMVSVAVNIILRANREWTSCEELLQEGDFTPKNKNSNKIVEKIGGVYWAIVLAIFLGWSFMTNRWDYTWIVWPVTAVLFGAVSIIVRTFSKE